MGSMYQIEKLEESNYDGWKIHMRSVLIHSDLWGYVSGDILKPAELPLSNEWINKDQKALSMILLSMKRSHLNIVKNAPTSREAWLLLEKKFQWTCPKGVFISKIIGTENVRWLQYGGSSI